MVYDYLIWGNWPSIYLWLIFFGVIGIYALYKYNYGLDNLTDKKFKTFFICCFVFFLFYIFIYEPYPRVIQSMMLLSVNTVPHFSINFNAGPFFGLVVLLGVGMTIYYIVKLATKKAESYLPKKSSN